MPTKPLPKIPMPIELTESNAEAAFQNALNMFGRDLPKGEREWEVPEDKARRVTGLPYRVDWAWPARRLVVEVQGGCHRIKKNHEKDQKRHNALILYGYTILYFTAAMIYQEPDKCVDIVREILFRSKAA